LFQQPMRHFLPAKNSLCLLLMLAVRANSQVPPRTLPADVGVYLGWVGTYPGNRLQGGARLAKQAGFQTIRVPLVASAETDFGMGGACHGKQSLESLVSLPAYAQLLKDRAFRTIFLTVWGDSNSYDACESRDPKTDQHPHKRYLEKAYYSDAANRDRTRGEYADLTYRLYKTYGGSGKVIGISNWEGDNELYCDSAYYFATNVAFRSSCEAKRKTADALEAYRHFLELREQGIHSGRQRALREGLKGVSVISVIEVSALRFLKEAHLPSMLEDVIPSVTMPDYVSYSAWESIGSTPDRLFRDLRELQNRFKGHAMVGEFGFDRGLDKSASEHAASAITTMRRAHVSYSIWWQIFDQPPLTGLGDKGLYGLYDDQGKLTAPGKAFLSAAP
jgi:hypothetical protein